MWRVMRDVKVKNKDREYEEKQVWGEDNTNGKAEIQRRRNTKRNEIKNIVRAQSETIQGPIYLSLQLMPRALW